MRKGILLVLGLVLTSACGMNTNASSRLAHGQGHADDQPVTQPADLREIKAMFDKAVTSGDMHEFEDQIAAIDTLYVVPIAKLRQDIGLTPGFGEEYIRYVPTHGAAAIDANQQLAFDLANQGIAMLHNFHYIGAARSFEQALRVDPTLIDAKILLALAYPQFSGDINGYIHAANELAGVAKQTLTPVQDAWFKFAKEYVFRSQSNGPLQRAFWSLMDVTGRKDLEVMTLGGWLSNAGDVDLYKAVLAVQPKHVGANHYLNHLYEFENDFQSALPYAKALAEISVADGHAQHMYGHVLPMVGKLEEALVQFQKSDKIHKDWAARNNYELSYDWHTAHNDHLMGVTLLGLGRHAEAAQSLLNGCATDFRACDAAAKMSAMTGDKTLLGKAQELAKKQYPADQAANVDAFFGAFGEVIDYLAGTTTDGQRIFDLGQAFQNPAMQVVGVLSQISPNSADYQQVLRIIDSFFGAGGFDTWTNGYPNAMIVRAAAVKFNQPGIVDYVNQKVGPIVRH